MSSKICLFLLTLVLVPAGQVHAGGAYVPGVAMPAPQIAAGVDTGRFGYLAGVGQVRIVTAALSDVSSAAVAGITRGSAVGGAAWTPAAPTRTHALQARIHPVSLAEFQPQAPAAVPAPAPQGVEVQVLEYLDENDQTVLRMEVPASPGKTEARERDGQVWLLRAPAAPAAMAAQGEVSGRLVAQNTLP